MDFFSTALCSIDKVKRELLYKWQFMQLPGLGLCRLSNINYVIYYCKHKHRLLPGVVVLSSSTLSNLWQWHRDHVQKRHNHSLVKLKSLPLLHCQHCEKDIGRWWGKVNYEESHCGEEVTIYRAVYNVHLLHWLKEGEQLRAQSRK